MLDDVVVEERARDYQETEGYHDQGEGFHSVPQHREEDHGDPEPNGCSPEGRIMEGDQYYDRSH